MENKYIDFHQFDVKIDLITPDEDYCLGNGEKEQEKWIPFLSFPITKQCNFRCQYCGLGGEATASNQRLISVDEVSRIVDIALKKNIKKFRITGGEPFTHPHIREILNIFNEKGVFTLINTNGSLIKKHKELINNLNSNFRFAVSLDSLKPERLSAISRYHNHKDVIDGINILKSKGLLMRINMVVSSINYDEVYDIISFCQELGCDLKLLDIVSVPVPFGERDSIYQEISSLEKEFVNNCDEIHTHEYTRGFGTPCHRFRFGDVYVTIKNSTKGSHYDIEGDSPVCLGCPEFPCHEGLYDLFALSDGRICSCRWTEKQIFTSTEQQIDFLIKAFKKSIYVKRFDNKNMRIRQELNK